MAQVRTLSYDEFADWPLRLLDWLATANFAQKWLVAHKVHRLPKKSASVG